MVQPGDPPGPDKGTPEDANRRFRVNLPLRLFLRLPLLLACLAAAGSAAAESPTTLELYFLPGCHDCREFEDALRDRILPALSNLGFRPEVRGFDILTPQGYERLMAETARLGWEYRGVPLLKAGDRFYYGDDLTAPDLAPMLAEALGGSGTVPEMRAPAPRGVSPAIPSLNLWVVLGAGLVDGINPCALATLLFLVSALALGGKSRISVGVIGTGFVAGVFIAYYLIGLGLLQAGAALSSAPRLRIILRILTALGLGVLGVLSLRDWRAVRRGRTGEITLRLPDAMIRRLHSLIRGAATVWLSGFGAAGLGVLVSLGEFVCTGQVYLPTLVYIAGEGQAGSRGLLAAYNLAFILPLALTFILVIAGMSHTRLVELFRRNLAAAKLILAVFFLSFGILMLAGVIA